jgi:excinuclease ABC subunit C
MTASALDQIPGLGDTRRKALLRHFGSVKKVRAASEDQIREVPGIGPALAATIAQTLAAQAGQAVPAVNVTTGEVLD